MEIIVSHLYADLDALSSMVLAQKLHPNAVLVFPGNISQNVKQFVNLYQDFLNVYKASEIDEEAVHKIIMVDNSKKSRIGKFASCIDRGAEVIIYDHHQETEGDVEASAVYRKYYGSNTTHILELILEKNPDIKLEKYEASLALMGIYEDTGNLTYMYTKPVDLEMAAFLLKQGADLEIMHEYTTKNLNQALVDLFLKLVENGEVLEFSVERIFITKYKSSKFINGVDEIINKIKDLQSCTACFIIFGDDDRANIIARSSSIGVRLNEILARFGDVSHYNAAAVVVRGMSVDEIYKLLKGSILENIKRGKIARDIMQTPVRSIDKETKIKDAYKVMYKFSYSGLPVVEDGRVLGIITRRDVDKALNHGFSNAPVRVYMATTVISAEEETPIETLKKLIVENGVGRIPIIKDGKLLGIVTRTEILRTLYEQRKKVDRHDMVLREKIKLKIMERVPERIFKLLKSIEEVSKYREEKAYLVGGIVRDLVLGIDNMDVDIVIEGDGTKFAKELGKRLEVKKIIIHEKFKTAVLVFKDGFKIDIASARKEYYEYPTSLPSVEFGSISEDLYRRDFTLNAMAIEIDYENFGKLIDYFRGYRDLMEGKIRILHNLSFIEDPTRIIRAFRFVSRYNFELEDDTKRMLLNAIEDGFLHKISWPRVKNELKIILNDKNPVEAIKLLFDYGIFETIHPNINYDELILKHIEEVGKYDKVLEKLNVKKWLIYFLILFENLDKKELELVFNKFNFSQKFKDKYLYGKMIRGEILKKLKAAEKKSEIYQILKDLNPDILITLLVYADSQELKNKINIFIMEILDNTPIIDGKYLVEKGYRPGPEFREILDEYYAIQLDNNFRTRDEILKYKNLGGLHDGSL